MTEPADDARPLWSPDPTVIDGTRIAAFARFAEARIGPSLRGRGELHAWSIEDPDGFWSAVWDHFDVVGERGRVAAVPSTLPEARFFPEARLNLAENLLRPTPGVDPDADIAVVLTAEAGSGTAVVGELSRAELIARVGAVAAGLRERGVGPGDRIGIVLPVGAEALVATLAALSIGAVVASASPDFGSDAIVDRLGQLDPVVLVGTTSYRWNGSRYDRADVLVDVVRRLPSVRALIVVPGSDDVSSPIDPDVTDDRRIAALAVAGSSRLLRVDRLGDIERTHAGEEPRYERLPFDHPAYVLFTSGTTGKPKCLLHRAGGVLLKHLVEVGMHADVNPGDRLLYATTTGWVLWNWQLSALALGATLVLHDGSPTFPNVTALAGIAASTRVTHLGIGARILDAMRTTDTRPSEAGDLSALRMLLVTGSPFTAETSRWVADDLGTGVMPHSMSGGTDLVGCFLMADPRHAVWPGELQGPCLGMDVDVVTLEGTALGVDETGELLCRNSFPTVPIGIWGDDGSRLAETYFSVLPGVWTHGDLTSRTVHGGFVIHGRSDATLNVGGVRIGTGEIYSALEPIPEIADALAFAQDLEIGSRLVLLVVMADGPLDDRVRERIRGELRARRSPRHVPAVIAEVSDLPRTRTGKLAEVACAQAVNGRVVPGRDALANPDMLDVIAGLPMLRI